MAVTDLKKGRRSFQVHVATDKLLMSTYAVALKVLIFIERVDGSSSY
jgi:hypothetical protein